MTRAMGVLHTEDGVSDCWWLRVGDGGDPSIRQENWGGEVAPGGADGG